LVERDWGATTLTVDRVEALDPLSLAARQQAGTFREAG
jgi:hypothetical protein